MNMQPSEPSQQSQPAEVPSPYEVACHELAAMQQQWWAFLALGIGWVVLGTMALAYPCITSLLAVAVIGVVMLVGGVAQLVSAFWAGRWSGFLLQTLLGLLYVVVGYILMDRPQEEAGVMGLLIAAFLMIGGLVRIVVSLSERFPGWGWALLNGSVTLLLGLLIFRSLPASSFLIIGLFVGIEMIFNGWYWVMLSIGLKRTPRIQCQ